MNYELQKAEESLLELLRRKGPLKMAQIQEELGELDQSEVRAAIWTLRADGEIGFADEGSLKAEERQERDLVTVG